MPKLPCLSGQSRQSQRYDLLPAEQRKGLAMANPNAKTSPTPTVTFVEMDSWDHRTIRGLKENEIGRYRTPYADMYFGTSAALIAAGLVEEHMLPGQPNRNKVSQSFPSQDGRKWGIGYLQIFKQNSRIFQLRKGISKDEERRRIAAAGRARQAKEDKQFREAVLESFHLHLGIVRMKLVNKQGYGYDDETLGEFERVAEQLEDVLRDGDIAHGLEDEDLADVEENAPACKADASLQSFLKSVTSDLSLVKNEKPEAL
jgi:hypothetical protein